MLAGGSREECGTKSSRRLSPSLRAFHRRGILGYAPGRIAPIITGEPEYEPAELPVEAREAACDFVCPHALDLDVPEVARLSTENARESAVVLR
jgi:hypothetical protein